MIDASSFSHSLRKPLGNKRNEITPEDRAIITKLYSDFKENEYCQIYDNTEFIYREYTVMQPLQRSYAITEERINKMISNGVLNSLYDETKVDELENKEELNGKDKNKLDNFYKNKSIYNSIVSILNNNISEKIYKNPKNFIPIITNLLKDINLDTRELKKIVDKIVNGLSLMDKTADIQKDRNGNVLYDKDTKDTEIVSWSVNIDDYMESEVLPHVPDAKAFFEEDLGKKKPVIKTGAEIPFTRYFYKYQEPASSDELAKKFNELETSVNLRIKKLFGGN